jgi:hypothetical protein
MDIPELVRQLLILKSRLKSHVKMNIHINDETLRVRMWIVKEESFVLNMELDKWHVESSDFLRDCCGIAVENNLVSEQRTLKLWQ